MNRHHEYIRVKELITKNQGPEDVCVPRMKEENIGIFLKPSQTGSGNLSGRRPDHSQNRKRRDPDRKTGELKILGRHNHENVMAAAAMAYYAGVSVESIRKSVQRKSSTQARKCDPQHHRGSFEPAPYHGGIHPCKELITKNQGPEDVCVDYEDEVLRKFGENIVPKVVYFSSLRKLDQGIYLDGNQIILKTEKEEIPIVKTGELKILGRHNHENVMAAAAMAYYAGVSVESIRKSVCEFVAVPHRIEYVTEKNGVAYYNDSKGTNPDAAIKGIQAMNRPTLLIGGGYDKESSYDEWIESFDGKVRYLVLIGQTKEKIKAAAERLGFTDIILCEDLKEAVRVCAEKANPGDAVLLSPACASWGQFDNYEQRGDMFKEYVKAL